MPEQVKFGSLVRADLREVWPHEAIDFTPWLSDNLIKLESAINVPLAFLDREVSISSGRVDILAINEYNNSHVVIENQLEVADDDHFQRILSYSNGLKAQTVIWIAQRFEEKQLKAVRVMNELIDCFAIEISVYRVAELDNSPYIPQFYVMEHPSGWGSQEWRDKYNNFCEEYTKALERGENQKTQSSSISPAKTTLSKSTAQPKSRGELSEKGKHRQDFWAYYRERYPDDLFGVPEGFAGDNPDYLVEAADLVIRRFISKEADGMWIRGDDEVFERALVYLPAIREQLGMNRIHPYDPTNVRKHIDTHNRANWNAITDWMHDTFVTYRRILETPRAKLPK